jgi:hypothetical protein
MQDNNKEHVSEASGYGQNAKKLAQIALLNDTICMCIYDMLNGTHFNYIHDLHFNYKDK